MHGNHFGTPGLRRHHFFVQRRHNLSTAALASQSRSRKIDQNLPHETGANPPEVRTIAPLDLPPVDEPHVYLIDQSGGTQRVTLPLAGHLPPRNAMKFAVDQWRQPVQSIGVAAVPREQEPRQFRIVVYLLHWLMV